MKIRRGKKVGICSFLAFSLVLFQFQFINPQGMLCSSNVRSTINSYASMSNSRIISIKPLTKQENYSKWQKYKDNSTANPYLVQPSVTNPYSIGKLNPTYIQGFLNISNFARYLSGLPDDLETTDSENTSAQYGAVIAAGFDSPDYNPPKLDGMDDAFYKKALDAHENGITLLSGQVSSHLSYMNMLLDETFENSLLSVHHRREILSPQMKYTGFGVADKISRRYILMKTGDKSRSGTFDYDSYAWPNSGYFPCEMISSLSPWMVSLNPAKYDSTKTSNIKVTVTNKNDGTSKVMDSSTKDTSSIFFNTITNIKKTEFCIIFRPLYKIASGREFDVKITGVFAADSTPVEINYTVRFYPLSEPLNTTPTPASVKDTTFGYISPDFVNNQTNTSDLKKGFTVQVKGSDKYSTTNESGYFELFDVPKNTGNYTLVIKKEGFLTREVLVSSNAKQISSLTSPLYMWGGETDDDNCINMKDVLKVATKFNSNYLSKEYLPICDVNQDKVINMFDIVMIGSHFNCTSETYNDVYR